MAVPYREYYKKKLTEENRSMWINGMYTLDALSVVMTNAFSKKKADYLDKPIDIFAKTKAELEEEAKAKREKVIKQLNALLMRSKKE